MASSPFISVVSASWNQGRYLEECLKSVEGLEPGVLEHIVVDNCSDDETHEVLRKYPHVRAIIEPDSGQSEALNKGFRTAKGEWVLWLNVDDFLLPGVIQQIFYYLKKQGSNLDMVYGHMVFVDAVGQKMRTILQPQWHYWMTRWGGYAAPSTGSFFRRERLVKAPLDEQFHMIMDTEWMLRTGKTLKVRRLLLETMSFRVSDNKTAHHINENVLTPQHQKERKLLVEKFPGYPDIESKNKIYFGFSIQNIKKKIIRVLVLSDKFLGALVLKYKSVKNKRMFS